MEMTKIVKPFIRKGVTQYFWQYSVYMYSCLCKWSLFYPQMYIYLNAKNKNIQYFIAIDN